MSDKNSAHCPGCDVLPVERRVYLGVDWKEGDPVPEDVTWHRDERWLRFAFTALHGKRVYIPE